MKRIKLLFILLLFTISSALLAGVNLKNGNFYISYTDLIVPGGGHDLMVSRTYNSKSADKGWFGFGWGNSFETYLVPAADGSVVIHENGSGATTRFTPKEAVNAEQASKQIVDVMRKKSPMSDKVAATLVKRLKGDAELRQAYARRFGVAAKLAVGTILYSNARGIQKLQRTKSGYKRLFDGGGYESFDKQGRLSNVKDKDGYSVKFVYKKGALHSIRDSQAKQIFFSWYPSGRVKSSWSSGEKKASYKYDGDNLVESTDVSGNVYSYSYDFNHNLTKVSYKDGSDMSVTYTPKTQFVSSVKSKSGDITKYEYDSNPQNPRFHYWTVVTKQGLNKKPVANRYEYEIKSRPDGSQYTYRILTIISKIKTETIYSECCSLPLKITRGNNVTTFDYNKRGLLTKKSSSRGDMIKIDYHKRFNKVSRVVDGNGWTNFEYDKRGNLYKAQNSQGQSVLLIYDRKGRITKMVDYQKSSKKKRALSFKYNSLGKPVEIAMSKVGKINVAYDNYGEIKKVESKAGHRMALQVTQAFQSLLKIVKPAGVNLSM